MKKEQKSTTVMRVSTKTLSLVNKIQKIVAVESNGEILLKTKALEIALEEFIDRRED